MKKKTLGTELVAAVREALASKSAGIVVHQKKGKITRSYDDLMFDYLKTTEAINLFVATAFEEYTKDGDVKIFLNALYIATQACGGLSKVAKKAHMTKASLEKVISGKKASVPEVMGMLYGFGVFDKF